MVSKIVSKLGGASTKRIADWISQESESAAIHSLNADSAVVLSFDNVQRAVGTSRSRLDNKPDVPIYTARTLWKVATGTIQKNSAFTREMVWKEHTKKDEGKLIKNVKIILAFVIH